MAITFARFQWRMNRLPHKAGMSMEHLVYLRGSKLMVAGNGHHNLNEELDLLPPATAGLTENPRYNLAPSGGRTEVGGDSLGLRSIGEQLVCWHGPSQD
ncbi:MAG: hypothetical protein IPM83_11370 [Ignavibacteria bacterium]|nr:hypothetical protein [Ignavibacteria bacterium]